MSLATPSTSRFAGVANLVPHFEINRLFDTHRRAHPPVAVQWGRSESLDPDNVGDIADEGVGHRG